MTSLFENLPGLSNDCPSQTLPECTGSLGGCESSEEFTYIYLPYGPKGDPFINLTRFLINSEISMKELVSFFFRLMSFDWLRVLVLF
jgi:hypothetical protein